MAEFDVPGAPLLSSREEKAGETMGKPSYAKVIRRFDMTNVDDPQRTFDEAVTTAEENGWVDSRIPGPVARPRWWRGKKTIGSNRAVIEIGLLDDGPLFGSADLVLDIRMEVLG